MYIKHINVKWQTLLIISSIYDKLSVKLDCLKQLQSKYDQLVINGNITFPKNLTRIENDLIILNQLLQQNIIYILGDQDLKLLIQLTPTHRLAQWLIQQPHLLDIKFDNQSQIKIVNGGVVPGNQLGAPSLEPVFVSHIDGKNWHHSYDGGQGYVISNLPHEQQPRYHPFSLQMGSNYSSQQIWAQELDQFGLKNSFLI